jgi:hypothetical protein
MNGVSSSFFYKARSSSSPPAITTILPYLTLQLQLSTIPLLFFSPPAAGGDLYLP